MNALALSLSFSERIQQCVLVIRASCRVLKFHSDEHPVKSCRHCQHALDEIQRVNAEIASMVEAQ